MVPKKVSEPVSKKIGTEKSLGTGLGKIRYRKKSRNRSRKNLVPKKNIGTSLEIFRIICVDLGPGLVPFPGFLHFFGWYRNRSRKNLVPKKVSESVSKKISIEKSLGIGLEKFWYRKKSRNRSRKNLVPKKSLGTSFNFLKVFVLVLVSVSSRSQDFCNFFFAFGTGLEKI